MTEKEAVMVEEPENGLTVRPNASVMLTPVMNVEMAIARLKEFQEFCGSYLKESKDGGEDGGDYGIIPGTKRKTLLKSGAEKLCEVYGIADEYVIVAKVEQWETGLFDYTVKCVLKSRRDDSLIGTGMGSCSTWESRYRWRTASRVCPACRADAIIKGKAEYGGGWLCFQKRGGCGAKFADDDPSITGQDTGRVENTDIVDQKNTVLKMAKKRAKIDAVIGVTRSSGIFTQDMEDLHPASVADGAVTATMVAPSPRPATAPSAAAIAQEFFTDDAPHPADAPAPAPVPPAASTGPKLVPPKPSVPTPAPAAPLAVLPDGAALVTGINVKNGTTGGKPWTLYIVRFDRKVATSDNARVDSGSTFDDKVATEAENARKTGRAVRPTLIPGKGKGSYDCAKLDVQG